MSPRFLVNKSALTRMPFPRVHARLAPLVGSGEAASCAIIDLEVLYGARNQHEHRSIPDRRRLAYELFPLSDQVFDRAIEVQGKLARSVRNRLPIHDLIVAAAAELAGLTVLHYDADFDRIATVTGQSVDWVVPRGSL